jgi:hypothetical protein
MASEEEEKKKKKAVPEWLKWLPGIGQHFQQLSLGEKAVDEIERREVAEGHPKPDLSGPAEDAVEEAGLDTNSLLQRLRDSAMGGYKPIGGPENVSNVNPYTQGIMGYLFGGDGQGGMLQTLMERSQGGANLPTAPELTAPTQMGALTSYAEVPGTPQQPGGPSYETFGQPAALTRLMGENAGPQTSTVSAPTQGQQPTYGATQLNSFLQKTMRAQPQFGTTRGPGQTEAPVYGRYGENPTLQGFLRSGAPAMGRTTAPQMPGAPDISSMVPGSPNINMNVAPGDFNAYNAVQMPNAPTPTDPNAAFNQFIGYAPQLQGLAQGSTSRFAQEQLGLADMMADDAVQDVLNQYSGQGAYYSGPAMQAAVEAAARPRQEAIAAITGQQSQTAGQLMGQGLQQMPGAYQAAGQQGIDLYNIGTNAALGLGTQGIQARGQNLDYLGLKQQADAGNRDAQLALYQLQQEGGLQQAGLAGDIYRSQLQYGADVYGTQSREQNLLNQLAQENYATQLGTGTTMRGQDIEQQIAQNRLLSGDYQSRLGYAADVYGTEANQQNVINQLLLDRYAQNLGAGTTLQGQTVEEQIAKNRLLSGDYQAGLNYGANIYGTDVAQQNVLNRIAGDTYNNQLATAMDIYSQGSRNKNLLNELASRDYGNELSYTGDIYSTGVRGALGTQANAIDRYLANTGAQDAYQRNLLNRYGTEMQGALGNAQLQNELARSAMGITGSMGQPEFYEPNYVYEPGLLETVMGTVGSAAPAVGGFLGSEPGQKMLGNLFPSLFGA